MRRSREAGAVLFIALIVLVAMMLASIALVRSVDTTTVITGNLAFRQAAVQAGDVGVEAAVTALPGIIASTLESDSQTSSYWYYATRRETDTYGVPTTKEAGASGSATPIDWNSVPTSSTVGGNAVKIVVDRLCRAPTPVVDIPGQCFYEPGEGGNSNKIGSYVAASSDNEVYYRVTARVQGPRDTVSMVQAIVRR